MILKLALSLLLLGIVPIALASGGGLGIPLEGVDVTGPTVFTGSANVDYIPPLWSTAIILSGVVFIGFVYYRSIKSRKAS